MSDDSTIGPYLRAHLAGASAGIFLFGRSRQADPRIREVVAAIHAELLPERALLRRLAADLDVHELRVAGFAARAALTLTRLTFRGPGPRRTALADLAELETMHDAVSGKLAGWRALTIVVDSLPCDPAEIEQLIAQAERQRAQLADAHTQACARDLRV